jgi:IclR family transcriptional regulator, KDG regulon repressor
MPKTSPKTSYDAPAVTGAVRIIEYLCERRDPAGISDIANHLGLNKNMTYRIIHTLQKEGWILQVDRTRYTMGLSPFHHLAKPISRMDIMQASREPLRQLWEKSGESCYLGIIDGTRTLFLEHLDAIGDVRITARPGSRFHMHCAAPGKVLLAFSNESFVDKVVSENGLPAHTRKTFTSVDALKDDLQSIRKRGYGLDIEEYAEGLICFAAPIFNHHSEIAGAIGLSVLTLYYSKQKMIRELGPLVLEAAARCAVALGYPQ